MPKQGEIDYLRNIGPEGITHSVNKPFSDALCGRYLMEIGAIMTLLPPPPARLLDLGCGTGWTSLFFARRSFDVVGQDIAPDAIEYACSQKKHQKIRNLEFIVSDYEDLSFKEEFDCAVFFDSLTPC